MTEVSGSLPADLVPPSASLWAGIARRDITPPVGIYARMWGAARHDVAEGVHRPLYATVVAMSEDRDRPPLILASVDLGWWQRPEDEWHVRGGLIEALGLDADRVMVACTHTHAGASVCLEDVDKPGGDLVAGFLDRVRASLIEAGHEAVERLAPAIMTWAYGRCDLAANRDLPEPGSSRVVCGFNPAEPADDTLLVGRICDAAGRVTGTLVNYACHPTTLAWENRLISPDYVGAMRLTVERDTGGAPCLFLLGAAGELAPREQYTGDTSVADANGRRLGFAALGALESMPPPGWCLCYAGVVESGAALAVWKRRPFTPSSVILAERLDVELPLKCLPTEDQVRHELGICGDRVLAERLRRKLRVLRQVGSGPRCRMPAWIWRIGGAVFVGQANEAYSAFQVELRRRFPRTAVAVLNLVNGSCGYLSPPELYDRNVYQVWQSPFERAALPTLTRACEGAIARLLSRGL